MASGQPLSDAGLKAYMAEHPDPELDKAWSWTKAVNATIADMVHGVPPFPYMRESLQALQGKADVVVVSATPTEALVREWQEHDIAKYARVIAGQEMGSKKQHLALAAKGKYAPDHILMMGDAPGDMEAAKANGTLFFPINPGQEEKSWERFYTRGTRQIHRRHLRGGVRGVAHRRVRKTPAQRAALEEVAKSARRGWPQEAQEAQCFRKSPESTAALCVSCASCG